MDEATRLMIESLRKTEEEFPSPFFPRWGYLDESKQVVRCRFSDLLERFDGRDPLAVMDRRVGSDRVRMYRVSTVFLGLDHAFIPLARHSIWFETMVFRGGYRSVYTECYETYDEALLGHKRVLMAVHLWCRWLGYSRSHLRKIRREYEGRGKVLGLEGMMLGAPDGSEIF